MKYFLPSVLGEDNQDLEARLKVIVSSLENLVSSLRAREQLNLRPSYDLDKILSYYRQSNRPFLLNVGGLRFRYFSLRSNQLLTLAVVLTRMERSEAGFIPNSRFDRLESCTNSVVKLLRLCPCNIEFYYEGTDRSLRPISGEDKRVRVPDQAGKLPHHSPLLSGIV